MASVKFERVVSYSSEDPKYPAENLLKFGSKWKCKSPGEANAAVIFQLDQPRVIETIDIGNEHSAFIHVLVGRAASDEYESLLPASSFMSPLESDQSTNINRVRMFTKQDFLKPVADEKWDRIKVVCSQPFNKRVQYGLSFIVVKRPEENLEPLRFGRFNLKKENEDEDDAPVSLGRFHLKKEADEKGDVSVGSLFAKRKDLSDSDDAPAANGSPLKNNVGHLIKPFLSPAEQKVVAKKVTAKPKDPPAKQKPDPPPKPRGQKSPSPPPKLKVPTQSKSPVSPLRPKTHKKPEAKNVASNTLGNQAGKQNPAPAKPTTPSTKGKRPPSADKKQTNPPKKTKSSMKSKPFSQLLDGVTIVISGYVNPARSILRSKALDMGAKYKQDWDSTSTHLICAFKNTPKFRQVQGHGHIVQKDWIEQCHAKRKRFPWRRFALDVKDFQQPESEDEIVEEVPQASTSTSTNPSSSSASHVDLDWEVDTSAGCKAESGSDTEDELERLEAKSATLSSSSRNPYLSDTDVEDDDERPDTSHLPMPPLP